MNDKELMGYFVIHAKTERALFHVDDARRMFALAGWKATVMQDGFITIHYNQWKEPIDLAYAAAFKTT